MHLNIIVLGIVAISTLNASTMPRARAQPYGSQCDQLWIERNAIYKERGYCFKTQRAISYFGNAGCMYDVEAQLPLSPYDRTRIAEIRNSERALGCR